MKPEEVLARRIVSTLRSSGHHAYLVGGCVRDLLLGREPLDFDVVTDARPDQVLARFPRAQPVGAHFGVMLVVEDGAEVEVATFRSDHAYRDGRRPERVEYETDPAKDALRRDFTINALLFDTETGEVLDFANGKADLQNRLIRAIGDPEVRFGEDHLRLLRAVRFAANLGFSIEPATLAAIQKLHGSIRSVSAERVRDELIRILTGGSPTRGFELLNETGLLGDVLPEVAAMKGVAQPPEYHPEGDVWTHTLLLLDGLRNPTITLALGALLHDVGKPPTARVAERIRFDGHAETGAQMAVAILTRLRFPTDVIRRVEMLVANHLRFKDVQQMRSSTLKRFLRLDGFDELLELHRLDCMASNRRLENYEFVRAKLTELAPENLRPEPVLRGSDLIAAGYSPGPRFSMMLRLAEDAQLEGRLSTREEALALIEAEFGKPLQPNVLGN